jgi:hypothetical protein
MLSLSDMPVGDFRGIGLSGPQSTIIRARIVAFVRFNHHDEVSVKQPPRLNAAAVNANC